jgi:prevent-host-death family protein
MQESETNGNPVAHASERVPASEARDRLTELMNRAQFKGERFILTRNGEDVAAIIGAQELPALDAA